MLDPFLAFPQTPCVLPLPRDDDEAFHSPGLAVDTGGLSDHDPDPQSCDRRLVEATTSMLSVSLCPGVMLSSTRLLP